ncbi:uncharacterized protein LOC109722623 isoform X2 [Ananas comosus]|uniref:Uncharacterized protein LOC109722623 isoform X2 n=2 Tax=Ananas comosus TaxID=4615 RepID=A0A6P5GJS0_ANACO|nr:uncharacterized protein LOC109722623 isoform X2 [Ananas comosus]
MEGRERLTLTPCPSFRELEVDGDDDGAVHHESPPRISAVHRPDEEEAAAAPGGAAAERRIGDGGDTSDDDDDSEFSFVLRGPETGPGITADEIFSGGPVYPVFGRQLLAADPAAPPRRSPLRKLLSEERNASSASSSSSSSSVGDELDGIPPETYCAWAPSSARCRKSGSTGSLMRWRVLSDLVVGRSHSDGREKFVFLAAEEENKKKKKPPIPNPNPNTNPSRGKEEGKEKEEERSAKGKGKKSDGGKVTESDTVTARRVYYGKGSNSSGGRRSFLPYKQDLLGFFANVNGGKMGPDNKLRTYETYYKPGSI